MAVTKEKGKDHGICHYIAKETFCSFYLNFHIIYVVRKRNRPTQQKGKAGGNGKPPKKRQKREGTYIIHNTCTCICIMSVNILLLLTAYSLKVKFYMSWYMMNLLLLPLSSLHSLQQHLLPLLSLHSLQQHLLPLLSLHSLQQHLLPLLSLHSLKQHLLPLLSLHSLKQHQPSPSYLHSLQYPCGKVREISRALANSADFRLYPAYSADFN